MRLLVLAACIATAFQANASLPEGVEPSFLVPSINGKQLKEPGMFWQQDGRWIAEAEQWRSIGVLLKQTETGNLAAGDLGVEMEVNDGLQTVNLVVPAERLPAQSITRTIEAPVLSPSAPGFLVNYDLAGRISKDNQAISVSHEVRTGGRWGVLSTSGQANWSSHEGSRYVRGSTFWQLDDYKRRISYQAGDVIAGGSSSVSLGGVKITKDPEGLDPNTPIYAQPTLGGLALDNATVTVLSNKALVAEHDVSKGPFTVERYPLAVGRSRTQLVVTDAFGRQATLSDSQFYYSQSILKKGANTWELAAGALRHGLEGYGEVGASGQFAYGLTDRWTVQGGMQADKENRNASVGFRTVLGVVGTLEAQVGQSSGPQGKGDSYKVAYNYQGPQFGIRAEHERNDNYWRLSNLPVEERSRISMNWHAKNNSFRIRAGASTLKTETLNVRFADVATRYGKGPHSFTTGAALNLVTNQPQFDVGYRYQYDHGTVALRARKAPDITASVYGSYRGEVGDTRFNAIAEVMERAGKTSLRAGVNMHGETFDSRVDAQYGAGDASISGSMMGSLHLGKGGVSFMKSTHDSFAVIEIPGVAGVPVKVNGRVVGTTDKNGRVVAGQLGSLIATQIKLDDRELPPEVQVETSEQFAASKRRSGMHIVFPVKSYNARAFKVVLATGKALEPGTGVTSAGENSMVGFDGELFLEKAVPGQVLSLKEHACSITLPTPLPPMEAAVELVCK